MKSSNISNEFNDGSVGYSVKHAIVHVVAMGAMIGVIGLASPALALTAPIDPLSSIDFTGGTGVTAGDLVIQTAHGSWEMLSMVVDAFTGLLSIGGDVFDNMLEGNFMPSTWDSVVMSHEAMEHGM